MKLINWSWAVLALISFEVGATPLRCGGDGPKPVNDISASFKHQVDVLNPSGGVKDFLFLEKRNAIVFRNQYDDIGALTFDGAGYHNEQYVTHSGLPLSRVTDSQERFFATSEQGWIFDIFNQKGSWLKFSQDRALKPLFWNQLGERDGKLKLYLMASRQTGSSSPANEIFEYHPGDPSPQLSCGIKGLDGQPILPASGSAYPYVYFFSSVSGVFNHNVMLYEMDVRSCKVKERVIEKLTGEPKNVFIFSSLESVAVQVDHPNENLLWFTPDGCRYFDLHNADPIVPNPKQPMLATWSKADGIQLYFLNSQKRATILKDFPISGFEARDAWLADNGQKLFLTPHFQGESYKWMIKVDMGKVQVKPDSSALAYRE